MTQTISRLNPVTLPDAAAAGYSQITTVEPGRLAFISGQVAWTRDGDRTPQGLTEQAALVVKNAQAALAAVGAAARDVIMVRIYMVDLTPQRLEELTPYLATLFDGAQPSVTGVGVAALAAPDLQLEIEMIVRLPS